MTHPDEPAPLTDRQRRLLGHLKRTVIGGGAQAFTRGAVLTRVSRRTWPNVATVEHDLDALAADGWLRRQEPRSTGGRAPRASYTPTVRLHLDDIPPVASDPKPPPDTGPSCERCHQPSATLITPINGRGRWCPGCCTQLVDRTGRNT